MLQIFVSLLINTKSPNEIFSHGEIFQFAIHVQVMGAYGPLLLAPVEGFGGPLGPLTSGGNLF